MDEAPGTPTQPPTPDAPPAPLATPPPPPRPAVSPTAAASVGSPGAPRWIVPTIAGIVTSMVVQILAAQLGLAAAGLLLPVGLGLLAGTAIAGRLANAKTAGGWVTAALLVFVGQILVGLVILQLFLR